MQCTLELAGKTVKPLAGCKRRIPASVKGKRRTIRFTATYDGVSVTHTYPVRVTK